MSGYRTLHRIPPTAPPSPSPSPSDAPAATPPPTPTWRVKFSPCRHHDHPNNSSRSPPALRLLVAGGTNVIRAYSLRDTTEKDLHSDDVLDASAMTASLDEYLVPRHYRDRNDDGDDDDHVPSAFARHPLELGYASLDVARNHVGEDLSSGSEIVAASQLGGRVAVWFRLDPALLLKGFVAGDDDGTTADAGETRPKPRCVRPRAEFRVPNATGTTLAIRPPCLGNYYSNAERDVLVALGCVDGSVALCKTGILAARPGSSIGSAGGVVGDTSSASSTQQRQRQSIEIMSGSTPGDVVATVGGGHACVMSLDFHPTLPNTFVVGRKDGTVDIYSSSHGDDDRLAIRRVHHLVPSHHPIRALTYSRPDGALLFAGDDDGKVFSFDASIASAAVSSASSSSSPTAPPDASAPSSSPWASVTAPVKLVACALTAHRGWVMHVTPFPDGRRLATCGSDGAVKVWDCGKGLGSGVPVHSFERVHDGWVWGVGCGRSVGGRGVNERMGRLKLVSCGNDGVIQIFSCEE